MNTDFNEDALRELELWPYIALQRQAALVEGTGTVEPEDAVRARPVSPAPSPASPAASHEQASTQQSRPAAPRSFKPAPVAKTIEVVADPARVSRIAQLDWQGLKDESAACQACGLCKQRKQAVLGVGAVDAPWLLVGEGPGAEEDQIGEPFVGQAGKLLDAMLSAAGLQRGREVYIANVVKCRPPGNRTPSAEEALACAPFLDRQIDLIKPKLIVALGKTAATRLTGSEASMASLRGKTYEYRGIPVVVTYHPSYMLRTPTEKLKSWEDLMFAKRAFVAAAR
ncbi:MAG: uracil-DNA glycosylase [Betaproteobacteria bacterium]|nr:uracil-DNA glycosylase [Betaproteobacteria bacterium]